MIFLLAAYFFLKAIFWCFAAMIWLCFASAAWMMVLLTAVLLVWFDRPGTVRMLSGASRVFAPPAYLRFRKSHA